MGFHVSLGECRVLDFRGLGFWSVGSGLQSLEFRFLSPGFRVGSKVDLDIPI